MDKNEKEKKLLYEWSVANNFNYSFSKIDKEKKSYFIPRKSNSYIREYFFNTLPELMNELDSLYEDNEAISQILKVVGIASLKNKPSQMKQEEIKEEQKKLEDKLPAFIYNF